MTDTVLSITGLTLALPPGADRPHAVEDLSFDIRPNEIVCIIGESGSGKSITSFATMGLLPKMLKPKAGQILFEGRDMLSLSEAEHAKLRGNRMAMIFQEPMSALNPCYTVGDQIEEVFAAHTSLSKQQRRAKTMALLDEVRLPDPQRIYHSFPHQLSGGQRQRIVIAIALALDPSLLIADEPTTALDVTTQAQILAMFRDLKARRGAGIMFITHDFDVVAEVADRVVVMQRGRVVEQGTVDAVLNHPTHPYTRQLIDAVPRRTASDARPLPDSDLALQVVGLEKTFHIPRTMFTPARTVQAVKPTSFDVRRGETLAIVGESGSGKSTLVRCLIRLTEPDDGAVLIDGVNLMHKLPSEMRAARKDIQIVFQDPYGSLNPRRTIGDQLIEGPINFGVPKAKAIEKALELLRIVRMQPDALNRYPTQFSGGQRQRICIARALMVEPKILIADEAVSALDVSVQKEVLQLLADIRDRMGLTMLFITHDLRVAAQISDSIVVMCKGEAVERGTVAEVFGNPQSDYTKTLLAAMPGQNWELPDLSAATA
ncbi:dipeptide ABC transporter ATP-binding protein [Ketogulonicigenium vulgare]|uniref:Predicted ATPase component of various ABC-type transport system n=1 Tax=Ketogulonicigenium vulgare (strain WSH-001) TaxID=759362 RepID=F9Y904_KETVW|nr:ABC transporter ATP-binding protein [Ketogulonicigenium vulgare]ADO41835.1 oligopeptide ABC transporter, ATP-binding protein [Ketogulonicigenium vulgare Y25]AEM40060.1 predicted ATPase component of various ABC-type transport system [Ketogulonicigenium vulgare WSH-001]ALJ80264.1 microcin ABC transporter ATP-binding protein [Ketogulonicigenium vulgare]ANW33120.1 microcin ABC transporter ATP-binding protein [Ketogulonicigenium vulgare]AOZ53758.1 peptide ABC transporter [Ketogulonicigenium vulg